jgi:hypothetical protein
VRHKHEPEPLYKINERSLAASFLAPHRARDWMVCRVCGQVGLRSRNLRVVHWRGLDAEFVQKAEQWNAWAEKQPADV